MTRSRIIMTRQAWPWLALAGLALALAACAPGNGVAEEEPPPEDEPDAPDEEEEAEDVALRVTVWTGADEHLAMFDDIADAFIAEHDRVSEIEFDVLPFEEYNDALTVQLAGGNPPDLGWVFERNAPEFIEAGVLADVGPALQDDPGYDFDDISESALGLWQEDDAVHAYPFSTSPFNIFYNEDLFTEADLELPSDLYESGDWTWEAVRGAGTQIVDADVASHGFVVRDFDYTIWDNLATVWRGFGARAWSEDGVECGMNSPEMVDAMTFFHGAVFDDAAHPGPGQSADFFAGDAAMTVTQISRATLLEDDGFAWGVVPLPAGPAGDAQVVGQAGVGVFGQSAHIDAATEFLAFMTNEENSRTMAQFFPPPRESLLTADVLAETNPRLSEQQLEDVVIQGIAEGDAIPSHRSFAQLSDTIRADLDALWEDDADVPAVLNSVCEAAQPLLEQ